MRSGSWRPRGPLGPRSCRPLLQGRGGRASGPLGAVLAIELGVGPVGDLVHEAHQHPGVRRDRGRLGRRRPAWAGTIRPLCIQCATRDTKMIRARKSHIQKNRQSSRENSWCDDCLSFDPSYLVGFPEVWGRGLANIPRWSALSGAKGRPRAGGLGGGQSVGTGFSADPHWDYEDVFRTSLYFIHFSAP